MITYSDISNAEFALEQLKSSYLRRFGWDNTCNMPGAYWMWRRDFHKEDAERLRIWEERSLPTKPTPYGIITATTDVAIGMTVRDLDEQLELKEDGDELDSIDVNPSNNEASISSRAKD